MTKIHASAIIDKNAQIHPSVEIGAYSLIGANVQIDEGTKIGAHTIIEGHTSIGKNNHIYQFASIGAAPQDKKYAGEPTKLQIGDNNTIREFVTINTGTIQDQGITNVGDNNWIMAYVHIAHDCQLASNIILANSVQLAGHVQIQDWVFLGGLTGVHQFTKIGAHAMTAFQTRLSQDLPPFVLAAGNPSQAAGINIEGLKRRGYSSDRIKKIQKTYKLLHKKELTLAAALEEIQKLAQAPEITKEQKQDIQTIQDFIQKSKRGIVR